MGTIELQNARACRRSKLSETSEKACQITKDFVMSRFVIGGGVVSLASMCLPTSFYVLMVYASLSLVVPSRWSCMIIRTAQAPKMAMPTVLSPV